MKAEEPKEPRGTDKNSKEGNRHGKIQMSLLRVTNGVIVSKLLGYWFLIWLFLRCQRNSSLSASFQIGLTENSSHLSI